MVENIGSTLKNIEKVIYITLGTLILVYFITHVLKKQYSWIQKVKEKMHFSYIHRFLAMHGLRLVTFSLVNLVATTPETAHQALTFIFSIIALNLIGCLVIYTLFIISRTPVGELEDKHPNMLFMFADLKLNRSALAFWPVFFLRRLFLAMTVTFMKDFQGLQLIFLVCQSSAMVSYLLTQPFEKGIENFLLIFNELAVSACILNIFPFSDAFELGKEIRNAAGWSYIGFVAIQVLTNLALKAYQLYLTIKKAIPKVMEKLRKLWKKL